MVGVKQETEVASGRGEREGRVRDFKKLDRSANKHEFGLGWVKTERDGLKAMLEKRAPRLLAVDLKASEEGEKDM
jgi:hypothetical protein